MSDFRIEIVGKQAKLWLDGVEVPAARAYTLRQSASGQAHLMVEGHHVAPTPFESGSVSGEGEACVVRFCPMCEKAVADSRGEARGLAPA